LVDGDRVVYLPQTSRRVERKGKSRRHKRKYGKFETVPFTTKRKGTYERTGPYVEYLQDPIVFKRFLRELGESPPETRQSLLRALHRRWSERNGHGDCCPVEDAFLAKMHEVEASMETKWGFSSKHCGPTMPYKHERNRGRMRR
jgi:hypothetical protein